MVKYFMKMKKSKKRKAISQLRLEGQARRRREEDKGGQHAEVNSEGGEEEDDDNVSPLSLSKHMDGIHVIYLSSCRYV